MWKWITASRGNKVIAAACAVLLVLAVISSVNAYRFHSQMQAAKKAEKLQEERADKLEEEGEVKATAYRKALEATEPALKKALDGVREARTSLARVEEARRDLWTPPAVDNLAARFDRAVEALR